MSIQSIINFIDNKNYINDKEISFNNYFKGDIKEFYDNNEDIISIFKDKYKNKCMFPTDYSIIIKDDDNDLRIFISHKIENNELFWIIKIL